MPHPGPGTYFTMSFTNHFMLPRRPRRHAKHISVMTSAMLWWLAMRIAFSRLGTRSPVKW